MRKLIDIIDNNREKLGIVASSITLGAVFIFMFWSFLEAFSVS